MKNIIVIDNFYKDPWAVRDYALTKAKYLSADQLNPDFAGTESLKGIYSDDVIKKLEVAIGQSIEVNPKNFAFGVFAKTFARDGTKKEVHVDASDWTALLYLSRPEDCQGGTVFFENKKLGWNEIPNEDILHSCGYGSRENFVNGDLKDWGKDFSKWHISARVGMKFNRLVLFRAGTLFHAAEGYFGNTDENCRLLQLFFFKTKPSATED